MRKQRGGRIVEGEIHCDNPRDLGAGDYYKDNIGRSQVSCDCLKKDAGGLLCYNKRWADDKNELGDFVYQKKPKDIGLARQAIESGLDYYKLKHNP